MTSSYKAFCRLERRHFNTCSYFFVSCFSTSLLVLLKINGCVTWRRNTTRCFLSTAPHAQATRPHARSRSHTYPVQAYDHLVVVVLVLVAGGLQGQVQVGPGDAGDEEVRHGPQLQEGVVQRRIDQEQALLAVHGGTVSGSPDAESGGRAACSEDDQWDGDD